MPDQPTSPHEVREHLVDLATWISDEPGGDIYDPERVVDRYLAQLPGTPEVQRVRTAAGWHGRVLGANGEPVWTTEVLESPANVGAAYGVLARAARVGVIDVDER